MPFIQYGVSPSLLPQQAKLSGGNTKHLMTVETSFSKDALHNMQDVS